MCLATQNSHLHARLDNPPALSHCRLKKGETFYPHPMIASRHVYPPHKHLSGLRWEGIPWFKNSGGVANVMARARNQISDAAMEAYGGGQYPLLFTPFADNGNMLEPNEIAKRHPVCGDNPNAQLVSAALNVQWLFMAYWSGRLLWLAAFSRVRNVFKMNRAHLTWRYLFPPAPVRLAAGRAIGTR